MIELHFTKNKTLSIGVEIEVQLIDPITGNLKPVAPNILQSIEAEYNEHIKSEIFQSMLEIDTPICKNAFEVADSLRRSMVLVRKLAADNSAQVMMSGTHPLAHYAERLLTPSGRYFSLVDRNKWITRRLQIFGLHVHLGMRDGEHAIAMNNALCHYLPILLALSASSPYWHRDDTGLASSRITFFEAIPTGGHPYLLNSWKEFEELVNRLVFSKSIQSLKDLWWDIRPNVEYGTIEIRIADCPPTIKEVEAIVALIHTLAVYIDGELKTGRKFSAPPEWILRENKWRASRHGVQCDLIMDNLGTSVPFLEVWKKLIESTKNIWQEFNYDNSINFLMSIIENGPSYFRQRAHAANGLDEVVRHLVREGEKDQPEWATSVNNTEHFN